jgi:hypothetical protein
MENLMEKVTQRLGAQEIIRANVAAEAAETERLKKQEENYKSEIAELKENASRTEDLLMQIRTYIGKNNNENNDEIVRLVDELDKNLKTMLEETNDKLSKRLDETDEKNHDVGVRVYRNVQASLVDEQKKQTEEILQAVNNISSDKMRSDMKEQFKELTRKVDALYTQVGTKNNGVVPISVISLIVSIATLVLLCLRLMGMF